MPSHRFPGDHKACFLLRSGCAGSEQFTRSEIESASQRAAASFAFPITFSLHAKGSSQDYRPFAVPSET